MMRRLFFNFICLSREVISLDQRSAALEKKWVPFYHFVWVKHALCLLDA